jgi:hypothetical protein
MGLTRRLLWIDRIFVWAEVGKAKLIANLARVSSKRFSLFPLDT